MFVNGQPLAEPYKRLRPNSYRADFPGLPGSTDYQQTGQRKTGLSRFGRARKSLFRRTGISPWETTGTTAPTAVIWGFVPRELIVGKALIVYWSYESDSDAYRQTEVRDMVRQTVDLVTNFFGKTRWSRTFKIIR